MISTIEILYVIFKMNSFMLLWPPSWIYESHNTNFVNKWRKILGILWTSPNIWHITFCLRKQINLVIRHMRNRRCIYFGIWAQFVISITSNAFFYFYPKYIFIDNKNRSYLHLDRLFAIWHKKVFILFTFSFLSLMIFFMHSVRCHRMLLLYTCGYQTTKRRKYFTWLSKILETNINQLQ